MGKNQSKEVKEQVIIAQSGANVSTIEEQLNHFKIFFTVLIVILILSIIYYLCTRCYGRLKKWVHRQIYTVTPHNIELQNSVPSVAQQAPQKVKVISV